MGKEEIFHKKSGAPKIENTTNRPQRIATSVDIPQPEQIDTSGQQWRNVKNRLNSILLAHGKLKDIDMLRACNEIDRLTPDARELFISTNWGPHYFAKVKPLLDQLKSLEAKAQ